MNVITNLIRFDLYSLSDVKEDEAGIKAAAKGGNVRNNVFY